MLGAYTAGLVVLLGGDGGDPEVRTVAATAAEPELSPLERLVGRAVRQADVPQRDETDVPEFRAAIPESVQCKGTACDIVYVVAVPGRGRILAQQRGMVQRIYDETDVQRLNLRVVRGTPTGPRASPPGEEETNPGLDLLATTCDRGRLAADIDWSDRVRAGSAIRRICETLDADQGPQHGGGAVGGAPAE